MAIDLSGVTDLIVSFARDHAYAIPPLVFALGFAESLVVVSLFVPSTVLFLAIGAAHAAAGGSFVSIWLAGAFGAVVGDVVSFAFGRYLKGDLRRVWPFRAHPRVLARGRKLFRDRGAMAIVIGKFLGQARPFLPILAGALHMRFALFIPASAVSSLLWAGVFLAPGFGVKLLPTSP